jgi:hypothetical protein
MRSFKRSMILDSESRDDTGVPPRRLAGFDADAASAAFILHGTTRLAAQRALWRED